MAAFTDKLFRWKKKPFKDEKDEKRTEVARESARPKEKRELSLAAPKGGGKLAHVIIRPHVSEKSAAMQISNKYAFDIDSSASEQDVSRAVHDLYGVRPVSVNMIKVSGKKIRFGRTAGSTKAWKKAVVTLPAGKTIDVNK